MDKTTLRETLSTGELLMKFAPGDLVRNIDTNEDGKVIQAYAQKGAAMYMVSVPKDSISWSLGGRVAYWSEDNMDSSTNDSLGEGRCA